MGQSLQKFTPGSEDKMAKLRGELAGQYLEDRLSRRNAKKLENWTANDLFRAVCEAVEYINRNRGNTQFKIPSEESLKNAFNKHHGAKEERSLTEEEFQKILQDVLTETGFTGIGAKDILFYIFGVPATALLIKQGLMPKSIPNALFIPGITSATVFVLAKLNKL